MFVVEKELTHIFASFGSRWLKVPSMVYHAVDSKVKRGVEFQNVKENSETNALAILM